MINSLALNFELKLRPRRGVCLVVFSKALVNLTIAIFAGIPDLGIYIKAYFNIYILGGIWPPGPPVAPPSLGPFNTFFV